MAFFDTFKFMNHHYSSVQQTMIVVSFLFCCSSVFHPVDTVRRIYMNEANKTNSNVLYFLYNLLIHTNNSDFCFSFIKFGLNYKKFTT